MNDSSTLADRVTVPTRHWHGLMTEGCSAMSAHAGFARPAAGAVLRAGPGRDILMLTSYGRSLGFRVDPVEEANERWSAEGARRGRGRPAAAGPRANGDFDTYWRYHLNQERERVHTSRYANGAIPTAA